MTEQREQLEIRLGDLVYWREPTHGYISLVALRQCGKGPFTIITLEEGALGTLATFTGAEKPGVFQEFAKFLTTRKRDQYDEVCDAILAQRTSSSTPRRE